ncbi:MAG TPA: SurA N-terminal domain-containing protein, partial [Dehalococcoidia bacterium]|nr:SurA N-terminal domain-containing protein [Dehalococcoidia bacterium]
MAKKRRTAKVPTPTWESPSLRLGKLEASNRWQVVGFFGLIGVVIVALALVGAAVFVRIWEESSRPGEIALKVGPATYKLGYYAKRLETLVAQSGGIQNPSTSADRMIQLMTDTLIEEQIALQFAEEQGLSVTEEDIDQELRSRFGLAQPVITGDGSEEEGAATPAPTVSLQSREERFRLRYQRQLEESRLTEKEFREMVKAQLLITRLRDKFAQEVPASAESVRYRQIVIRDVQTADEVIARLAAGEDFAALARQRSL